MINLLTNPVREKDTRVKVVSEMSDGVEYDQRISPENLAMLWHGNGDGIVSNATVCIELNFRDRTKTQDNGRRFAALDHPIQ
jgi:hypothetical protein